MRTSFENLKKGSRFKVSSEGNADYVKVSELSYSYQNGPAEFFGDSSEFVYPVHPYELKDSAKTSSNINIRADDIPMLLLAGCVALMILCFLFGSIFSDPPSKRSDGVYEAATEKLDKGIPLNEREAKRIDDILNAGERERAREIEKKHGER